jgi:hypothetical protein
MALSTTCDLKLAKEPDISSITVGISPTQSTQTWTFPLPRKRHVVAEQLSL